MSEMKPIDSNPVIRAFTIIAKSGKRERSLRTRNRRKIRKILRLELSPETIGHENNVTTQSNRFQFDRK